MFLNPLVVAAANDSAEKTNNFLIPNGTFIFEWIVFIAVVVFLAKKVIPRITTMVDARQAAIQKQFEEAEATKARLEKAEREYSEALVETKREATRLREQVTSPKGTTEAALAVLMGDNRLGDLLAEAVEAARKRSVELGA